MAEDRLPSYPIRIEADGHHYTGEIGGVITRKAGPHESLGEKLDELDLVISIRMNSNHPDDLYSETIYKILGGAKVELQHPYEARKTGDSYEVVRKPTSNRL